MEITWTEDRIGELSRLWDEGHPASEIGRRMGLTKNTIIGKVHRIGLTPRAISPRALPPPPKVIEFNGPCCLWPHGHPGEPGFHFCGERPVAGKPYCAAHAAVAYIRPKEQKSNAA